MGEEQKEKLPVAETAEDILDADDMEYLEVEIPEWKKTIRLRLLPADEGLSINAKLQALQKDKSTEAMFILLSETIVNGKGEKILTSEEHFAKLHKKSPKVLILLQKKALELQGWRGDTANPKEEGGSRRMELVASRTD